MEVSSNDVPVDREFLKLNNGLLNHQPDAWAPHPGNSKSLDKSNPKNYLINEITTINRAEMEHPFRANKQELDFLRCAYKMLLKKIAPIFPLFLLAKFRMVRKICCFFMHEFVCKLPKARKAAR